MFFASLARFYGWSHIEIQAMPYSVAMKYWRSINAIQAREHLVDMSIADYPKMKKEGRSSLYKSMRKEAYPSHLQKKMGFEDFAKKVGMNG